MKNFRDPRVAGAWIVFLAALIIYFLTMAKQLAFWDVGEFLATAKMLGVPHPPGAPTFVLLGRLLTMFAVGMSVPQQVGLISVVSSAFAALFLYLIVLETLKLWEVGHEEFEGYSPAIQAAAAGTAALAYAFSHSAWFNAVEAEVYSLSMAVTALCLWLAFRHVRGGGKTRGVTLLLLIGYVLGIGAGNHLLALLTVPSIVILLWYLDRPALTDLRLIIGMVLLFVVGYSIYALLYIRSGLDPPIDMNNPENWNNFILFLQRRQYGSQSMLAILFQRRAPWLWQLDYHFLRYFRAEFLLPFYLLAIGGVVVNLARDKRTFLAHAALWTIMGLGLVVYLNMPDPQPRDRDYIFVGCYFATAIFVGTGMAGLAGWLRESLARAFPALGPKAVAARSALAIGAVGLVLVVVQTVGNYDRHDRTGDDIPWDYAHNILESCDQNAILFTNGDNDTYPLWYLQIVDGVRRDIRVVNLSLLNTDWYIKELRDREPKVPITWRDQDIDRILGYTYAPADTALEVNGVYWRLRRGQMVRTQDRMVAHMIANDRWEKPIYFAITVPVDNQAGFTEDCQLEGFAFRVTPNAQIVDTERSMRIIKEIMQFRALLDPAVHKDQNTSELIQNYAVVISETARGLLREGREQEAWELIQWGRERVPFVPDQVVFAAGVAQTVGDTLAAQELYASVLDAQFHDPRSRLSLYLGFTYSLARSSRYEEAAAVLERWLAGNPGDATARAWMDTLRAGHMPDDLARLVEGPTPR
jgi:hypothetical protein